MIHTTKIQGIYRKLTKKIVTKQDFPAQPVGIDQLNLVVFASTVRMKKIEPLQTKKPINHDFKA